MLMVGAEIEKLLKEYRNQVLEEAAKVCDEYRARTTGPHGYEWVSCEEVVEVAKEIRELKEE